MNLYRIKRIEEGERFSADDAWMVDFDEGFAVVPVEPDKVGDPADLIGWLRFSDDVQDADRFAIVRLREITDE